MIINFKENKILQGSIEGKLDIFKLSFLYFLHISLTIFQRKLRAHQASQFHIQLSLAIFVMLVLFVGGVEQASVYVPCVLVSLLLHYFSLASILWMGAEAALMFRKLVFVFKPITSTFVVVTSCICWRELENGKI